MQLDIRRLTRKMNDLPKAAKIAGAGLSALLLIGLSSLGSSALHPAHAPGFVERLLHEGQINDTAASDITAAVLLPALVQWGTFPVFLNYTGSGPPGIILTASSPGSTLNWTVEGWANETYNPLPPICKQPDVHFTPNDWIFEADGTTNSGRGTFVSLPTGSPARLLPDGDQCFLRAGMVEVWHVEVCLNKGGVPHHYYRDSKDHLHYDGWDLCIGKDVTVKPL